MEYHADSNSSNSSSSSTGESTCPIIIKRKRTKRHRTVPPPPPSTAASSGSSGTTTEEEEDMANCLILLAQGSTLKARETATATVVRSARTRPNGFYLYECKTCNKCFSSFQALGGHRASHKKPKMAAKEESEPASKISKPITSLSNVGKAKTHECSICGAEFSSGQALGGHMRRHRPAVFPEINREFKREKTGFSLDLNLPAPADDEPVGGNGAGYPPVFPPSAAAAALVDCYY